MSVSSSIFTPVIFKHASIANRDTVQKYAGSSDSYSFKHKVLNCSKISDSCVVSDCTHRS